MNIKCFFGLHSYVDMVYIKWKLIQSGAWLKGSSVNRYDVYSVKECDKCHKKKGLQTKLYTNIPRSRLLNLGYKYN